MAATFFEHQQLARRNSRRMVVLFLVAVAAVVIAVDVVLGLVYLWSSTDLVLPRGTAPGTLSLLKFVPTELYVGGAAATAGIILIVSIINVTRLADGGSAVAEMIGARRVPPDTRDPLERRLLNVVEEMAIASGVRVPGVYVMDGESGINAFAAGWDVSNSVVAVTRGTLETLTRDELQGVVGHEFSHILNGDMRLNIRMIGVLAGIVFIGSIGEFLMRSVRRSRSRNTGGIFLVGLAIFVIGYVGLFFARLIKAAVSRQREFLADASSVQFTRNPDGIAGALDQIRRASALIQSRYAEEMSHMFFGQSLKLWLGGLFDTHPPIDERIRRVRPGFQPSAYRSRRAAVVPPPAAGAEPASGAAGFAAGAAGAAQAAGRRGADLGTKWGRSAGESAALVGSVERATLDYAARLLASLPEALRDVVHREEDAGAAIVALLLAPKEEVVRQQIDALEATGLGEIAARAQGIAHLTRPLGAAFRLPLVDLALPAVKRASAERKQALLRAIEAAIHADRRISLHEFVVLTLVREQLAAKRKPGAGESRRIVQLKSEALTLLGLVARAGARADAGGDGGRRLQAAMHAGAREMGLGDAAAAPATITINAAGEALDALRLLAPLQKAILIKGLFAAVTVDGTIHVAEAELMRMIGAVLDCPLPPLLQTIDPATLAA